MNNLPEAVTKLSLQHGFNRSAQYDPRWMFDNSMGPNPLWLVEWLSREMQFSPDMVVLDMGCGKAITSIFLAQEFGCTVFANDLWISPDDNQKRIADHSLQRKVYPVHAEAHALPYAKNFFDSVVSIDSYQYYGTDDLYLNYFAEFVKPGGQIGIVVPGWSREPQGRKPFIPPTLPADEFACFHSCDWWRKHMEAYSRINIEKVDMLPDGKRIWLDSARALLETKRILMAAEGRSSGEIQKEIDFWGQEIAFLEGDKEDFVALIRIVVRRKG